MVFADADSPVYLQGAFDLAVAMQMTSLWSSPGSAQAKASAGATNRSACPAPSRAPFDLGYHTNLVTSLVAGLGGGRLQTGTRCGAGRRRMRSRGFDGHNGQGLPEIDFHRLRLSSPPPLKQRGSMPSSTDRAKNREVSKSLWPSDFPGKNLDLVTFFDCLHDMGDPLGAARHVRRAAEARRELDDRRACGRRSSSRTISTPSSRCSTRVRR